MGWADQDLVRAQMTGIDTLLNHKTGGLYFLSTHAVTPLPLCSEILYERRRFGPARTETPDHHVKNRGQEQTDGGNA